MNETDDWILIVIMVILILIIISISIYYNGVIK